MTSSYFFPSSLCKSVPNTENYTILFGALSSGNVPQLTIEAILTALLPTSEHFGTYHDPASMEPFVTNAGLDSGVVTMNKMNDNDDNDNDNNKNDKNNLLQNNLPTFQFAIELYINHPLQLIIVVQRGKVLPKRQFTFVNAFLTFLLTLTPSKMILLTSLGHSHRPAEHKDLIQYFTVENGIENDNNNNNNKGNGEHYHRSTIENVEKNLIDKNDDKNDDKNGNNNNNVEKNITSPIQEILQNKLEIPRTFLSDDEVDAYLQYLKIRYGPNNTKTEHQAFPFDEKNDEKNNEKKNNEKNNEKKSPKKPIQFDIPIKGGGLTYQYAKYFRKNYNNVNVNNVPLIGLVGFSGPNSIQNLANVFFKFILATSQSNGLVIGPKLSSDWNVPNIVTKELDEYC